MPAAINVSNKQLPFMEKMLLRKSSELMGKTVLWKIMQNPHKNTCTFSKAASSVATVCYSFCSFRQCDCIYFFYAIAWEGINRRSRSHLSFKISKYVFLKISQNWKEDSSGSHFNKVAGFLSDTLLNKKL